MLLAREAGAYVLSISLPAGFGTASGLTPRLVRFEETASWVHVACSWFHDIRPAREMGIRRIWLDRDRTGDDPTTATMRIETTQALPEAAEGVLDMNP